jgi:hypothetical protein
LRPLSARAFASQSFHQWPSEPAPKLDKLETLGVDRYENGRWVHYTLYLQADGTYKENK